MIEEAKIEYKDIIDAFSLFSIACKADLRCLIDQSNIAHPISFSLEKDLDFIQQRLSFVIKSMDGCVILQNNVSTKAVFSIGMDSLSILIETFHVIKKKQLIRFTNLHGEPNDFKSTVNQIMSQIK